MRLSPAAIEANRVRARERMRERHRQGLCSGCPRKAVGTGWRCTVCLAKDAAVKAELRASGLAT